MTEIFSRVFFPMQNNSLALNIVSDFFKTGVFIATYRIQIGKNITLLWLLRRFQINKTIIMFSVHSRKTYKTVNIHRYTHKINNIVHNVSIMVLGHVYLSVLIIRK